MGSGLREMAGNTYTERIVVGAAAGDRAAKHFTKDGTEAEDLAVQVLSKETQASYESSSLNKGYYFPQNPARLPGCDLCKGSRARPLSKSYSKEGTSKFKIFTVCQLLSVFLLAVLPSASCVYLEPHDPYSEKGNCSYSLIALAALSCQQFNESSMSPSVSCCTALLHAIDDSPPIGENGECCLCRYTRREVPIIAKLASSYVSCNWKDRANVARWSFPTQSCDAVCERTNAFPRKHPSHIHGSSIIMILSVAVLFLILAIGVLYFCWSRVSKSYDMLPVRNVEMQHRQMPFEAGPQMERRQSGQLKVHSRISPGRHNRHGLPNV